MNSGRPYSFLAKAFTHAPPGAVRGAVGLLLARLLPDLGRVGVGVEQTLVLEHGAVVREVEAGDMLGNGAAISSSRSDSQSTSSGRVRSTLKRRPKFARACASRATGSSGASSSTPSYVTPYLAMKSLRTAQNSGAFMGHGVPWLLASYLP